MHFLTYLPNAWIVRSMWFCLFTLSLSLSASVSSPTFARYPRSNVLYFSSERQKTTTTTKKSPCAACIFFWIILCTWTHGRYFAQACCYVPLWCRCVDDMPHRHKDQKKNRKQQNNNKQMSRETKPHSQRNDQIYLETNSNESLLVRYKS